MLINEIVKEFILYNYLNADTQEGEVIGIDLNENARIYLINDNGVILRFKKYKGIGKEEIEKFFHSGIFSGNIQIYPYEHGVSIFTRYQNQAKGLEKIRRALDIFKNFEMLIEQYKILSRLTSSE